MACSAVLLDLDDLLVSTKRAWRQAESAAMAELGGTYTDFDADNLTGKSMRATAEYLIEQSEAEEDWAVVAERIRTQLLWIYRHDPHAVELLPGAGSLVSGLRLHGIPSVLVTSTDHQLMYHVVAQTGLVFDDIVCAQNVSELKPHPEPYQVAARKAWTTPDLAVAVEDSEDGVTSARRAGIGWTIAVPSPRQRIRPGPGLLVIRSLTDIEVHDGGLSIRPGRLVR